MSAIDYAAAKQVALLWAHAGEESDSARRLARAYLALLAYVQREDVHAFGCPRDDVDGDEICTCKPEGITP